MGSTRTVKNGRRRGGNAGGGVVETFTVKRGEVTRVTLTATKPGLYPIICTQHTPSMQGTLVVLPK